jgi:hypothetical protein
MANEQQQRPNPWFTSFGKKMDPNRKLWKDILREGMAQGRVPVPKSVQIRDKESLAWKPDFVTSREFKLRQPAYRNQYFDMFGGDEAEHTWLQKRGLLDDPNDPNSERVLPAGASRWDEYGRPVFDGATSQREYDKMLAESQMIEAQAVSKEQAGWDWDAPNIVESFQSGGWKGAGTAVLAGGLELIDQGREAIEYKVLGGDEERTAQWQEQWNTIEDKVFGTLSDWEDRVSPYLATAHAADMMLNYGKPLSQITEEEQRKVWQDSPTLGYNAEIPFRDRLKMLVSSDFWNEAWAEGNRTHDVVYGNLWEKFNPFDDVNVKQAQGKSVTMAQYAATHPETEWYTLSRDLSNPTGDMVGRMLFDPLNVATIGLGWIPKGIRTSKAMTKIAKLTPAISALADGIQESGRLGKVADGIRGMVNLEGAAMRKVSAVASKVDELVAEGGKFDEIVQAFGKDYDAVTAARNADAQPFRNVREMLAKIGHLSTTSKQRELGNNAMNVARWAADVVRKGDKIDPDEFFQLLKRVADLDDPAKRSEALRELSHHGNIYKLMTEEGMQGIEVIAKAVDDYGSFGKQLLKATEDLSGPRKLMAVITAGDEFFEKTATKMYPTLDDYIKKGGKLPVGVRSLNSINNTWMKTVGGFQRSVFGLTQLGLSPGYAVRNFVQNTVQSLLDEGLGVIVGHSKMDTAMDWMGITRNVDGKLVSKLSGADIVDEYLVHLNEVSQTQRSFKGRRLGAADMRNVSGAVEKMGARAITGKVINDTMRKFLRGTTSRLLQNEFGVSRNQARYIETLLISNRGDMTKTFIQLHDEAKHGIRPLWGRNRMPAKMADDLNEWMGEDVFDEIMDTSDNVDEAVDRLRAHQKAQDKRAKDSLKDEVVLPATDDTHHGIKSDGHTAGQVADARADNVISRQTEQELHSAFSAHSRVTNEISTAKLNVERQFKLGLDGNTGGVTKQTDKMWEESLDAIKVDIDSRVGGGQMTGREYRNDHLKELYDSKQDNLNATWDEWIQEADVFRRQGGGTDEALDSLWKQAGFADERGDRTAKDMYGAFLNQKFLEKHKVANIFRDTNFAAMQSFSNQMAERAIDYGFPKNRVWRTDVMLSRADTARVVSATFDKHLPYQMVRDAITKGKSALKKGDELSGKHQLAIAWSRQFGLTSGATNKGVPMDKYILNIINKQTGRDFQSLRRLHNIDAADVEKALLRHSMGLVGEAIETPANVRNVISKMMSGQELSPDELMVAENFTELLNHVNPNMHDELMEKIARFDAINDPEIEAKLLQEIDDLTEEVVFEFNNITDLPASPVDLEQAEWDEIALRWGRLYDQEGKAYAQSGYALRSAVEESNKLRNVDDITEEAVSDAAQVAQNMEAAQKNVDNAQKAFDEAKETLEASITERIGVSESRQKTEEILEDVVRKENLDVPDKVYGGDTAPVNGRVWEESRRQRELMYDDIETWMRARWGKYDKTAEGEDLSDYIANLGKIEARLEKHMGVGRDVAVQTAKNKVEFILHDYAKQRNFDTILGYIYPYSFWYTRTYGNWIQRIAERPNLLNAYMNWKQKQAAVNADLPEYMQTMTDLSPMFRAFGWEPDHPMYANLDSMVNPLYGVLGIDFDDPDKRSDQLGTVMDNLGKFGPSIHQSYGMAYGLYLYLSGQEENAKKADKWLGRFLGSAGRAARAIQPVLGIAEDIGGVEIDPARIIASKFEGREWWQGMDPYEQGRIARGLFGMVEKGMMSEDQIADISNMDNPWESDHYRTAVAYARSTRQAGDIFSWIGAPAMRTRTQGDMEVDKIDAEFRKIYSMREDLTKEQYSELIGALYDKYPAADALFLMRKDPQERDAAFTYHVLRRIPPGASTEVYERVGLDKEVVQKFYDTNGKSLEDMNEHQRSEFMTGITTLSMALGTPPQATKQEWEAATKSYQFVEEQLVERYGEDVQKMVDHYWVLMKEDREQAYAFTDQYPIVEDWMNDRTQMLNNDPLSRKYYSSYGQGKGMYNSMKYDLLDSKYPEAKAMEQAYFDARARGEKVKAPDYLKDYWGEKDSLNEHYDNLLWSFGQRLDDGPEVNFRTDFPEEELTQGAQEFIEEPIDKADRPEYYNYEWSDWAQKMSPALQRVISDWAFRGKALSESAEGSLEFALRDEDITLPLARDLIRQSLERAGAQFYSEENPPTAPQPEDALAFPQYTQGE